MKNLKAFYSIRVSPKGHPDPECGPYGPLTLEDALGLTTKPDPLSGWRTIIVAKVSK